MRSTTYPLALLLSGACVLAASEPAEFDRALTVSGPVLLEVRSDSGGVSMSAGTDSLVRVHATIRSLYGRFDMGLVHANVQALAQDPPIEQSGNRIRVGYANPARLRGVSIHFDIEVPRLTEARVQTTSGGIRINGIAGPVVTETHSGHTEISNVIGLISATGHSGSIVIRGAGNHVLASSESGKIQVLSAKGPVELQTKSGGTEVSDVSAGIRSTTQSGSITIDNVAGPVVASNNSGSIDGFQLSGPIHAETKSGAIRLSQIRAAPIRARAHSGAITVDLADQHGYQIDAQSDSGKVSGPVLEEKNRVAEGHRLSGQLRSGGPLVDLDTHSSKIQIN